MASKDKKKPSTPSDPQGTAPEAGRAELTRKARASRLALEAFRSALLGYTTSERDLMLAGKLFPGSAVVTARLEGGESGRLVPSSGLADFQCSTAEREVALALRDLADAVAAAPRESVEDVRDQATVSQVLQLMGYPADCWTRAVAAGNAGRMARRYDARFPALLEKALHALALIARVTEPPRVDSSPKPLGPVARVSLKLFRNLEPGEGLTASQWVAELKKVEHGGHNVKPEYLRGPIRDELLPYGLRNDRNHRGYYLDPNRASIRSDVVPM